MGSNSWVGSSFYFYGQIQSLMHKQWLNVLNKSTKSKFHVLLGILHWYLWVNRHFQRSLIGLHFLIFSIYVEIKWFCAFLYTQLFLLFTTSSLQEWFIIVRFLLQKIFRIL
jgi:hypothetical protein